MYLAYVGSNTVSFRSSRCGYVVEQATVCLTIKLCLTISRPLKQVRVCGGAADGLFERGTPVLPTVQGYLGLERGTPVLPTLVA
jgi:hypothetical protein